MSLVLLLDASTRSRTGCPSRRRRPPASSRPSARTTTSGSSSSTTGCPSSRTRRPTARAAGRAIDKVSAGRRPRSTTRSTSTLKQPSRRAPGAQLRRRVVVLVSDGEDTASLVWEEQVLELVRRREATIHVIALRRGERRLQPLRAPAPPAERGERRGGPLPGPSATSTPSTPGSATSSEAGTRSAMSRPTPPRTARWRGIELRVRGREEPPGPPSDRLLCGSLRPFPGPGARDGLALSARPPRRRRGRHRDRPRAVTVRLPSSAMRASRRPRARGPGGPRGARVQVRARRRLVFRRHAAHGHGMVGVPATADPSSARLEYRIAMRSSEAGEGGDSPTHRGRAWRRTAEPRGAIRAAAMDNPDTVVRVPRGPRGLSPVPSGFSPAGVVAAVEAVRGSRARSS